MNAEPDLARLASTVGDSRRIQMLALLMEGRALTAKELALGAGIRACPSIIWGRVGAQSG